MKTAIILAGGFGTRLKSVVSEVPKPLAPINGRPFLAYLLDELEDQGIREAILAVGYKGQLVQEALGDSHGEISLSYSFEPEPLGTGGAIALALNLHNSEEAVWIINGDTFFNCDLLAVAKTHINNTADVTLALCHMDVADRYGLVEIDENHFITRFREKTPNASGLINAGIYLLEPDALYNFDFEPRFSLEKDFFEAHLMDMRVLGSPQPGYFVDIGIPEDYEKAKGYFTSSVN